MAGFNRFVSAVFVIAMVGLPVSVAGQEQPARKKVQVIALDGSKQKGHLVSLDTKNVVIEERKGPVTIPLTEVRSVNRVSYTIAGGTLIGLAGGLGTGLLLCANGSDCHSPSAALIGGGIGAGVGAAVGSAIKAARSKSRVLYSAPPKTSLVFVPVVTKGRIGFGGTIAW